MLEVIALPSYHYINTKYHNYIMQIGDIYAALCTVFEYAWKGSCNNLVSYCYCVITTSIMPVVNPMHVLKAVFVLQEYGN